MTKAQQSWKKNSFFVLDQILHPIFLASLQEQIKYQKLKRAALPDYVGDFEWTFRDQKLKVLLNFFMNDKSVFHLLGNITGKEFYEFVGRIYVLDKDRKSGFDWHDDIGNKGSAVDRTLGFSLNLNAKPFSGGEFELKSRGIAKGLVHNVSPGAALVFKVGKGYLHRVLPVTGHQKKICFAGWFLARK